MDRKPKVYLASGWFNEVQRKSEESIYNTLSSMSGIDIYSPRRQGTMLSPENQQDRSLRETVFLENIKEIESSDVLVVNVTSEDDTQDTGTLWESGYALSKGIESIAVDLSSYSKFIRGCSSIIDQGVTDLAKLPQEIYQSIKRRRGSSALVLVPPGRILESVPLIRLIEDKGISIHQSLTVPNVHLSSFAIAVIDDRDPFISNAMGLLKGLDKPVITYSNFDYGVNVMLLESIIDHCISLDQLGQVLDKILSEGIHKFEKRDLDIETY